MKPIKLKQFLASEMAEIDASNEIDDRGEYMYHYEKLLSWRDFDLLAYYFEYMGVFDGGESLLMNLNTN